jgi:hypothetical protein
MEKYGYLTKEGELLLDKTATVDIYKKETVEFDVKSLPKNYKPVVFASIPKFDQETQAVYQDQPVDKGDVIDVGVIVVDLPEEEGKVEEVEPAIKK